MLENIVKTTKLYIPHEKHFKDSNKDSAEMQKPSEMKDVAVILIKIIFLCKFKILSVLSYILVNIVYNELCMKLWSKIGYL
jgi:hypothetical protein